MRPLIFGPVESYSQAGRKDPAKGPAPRVPASRSTESRPGEVDWEHITVKMSWIAEHLAMKSAANVSQQSAAKRIPEAISLKLAGNLSRFVAES